MIILIQLFNHYIIKEKHILYKNKDNFYFIIYLVAFIIDFKMIIVKNI